MHANGGYVFLVLGSWFSMCAPDAAVSSSATTSSRRGKEGCAPVLVTEHAPAARPQRIASTNDLPSLSAVARPPLNASPAATVSTATTEKAGKNSLISPLSTYAPLAPILITTLRAP